MRAPGISWTTAAFLFALAACSGAAGREVETTPQPAAGSAAELEAIYRARIDSARMRFTEADVHFMTGMIGHHSQAIAMARLAPTHGASPPIQTLAGRIINAQQDEIALMQQWLRDRGQPVPEVHISGTTLTANGAEHILHMPGMLTPEQMQQLDQARGPDFDRLLLTYMIQHHRGAVAMVKQLYGTPGAAQDDTVFKFADDVGVDQTTEIARMERMLDALPPGEPAS
jgi:uncharacterized protein (DUF305 family)